MSLKDLNAKHLKLISLYSSRYAVRGGTGLVFVFLVLACGLMTAHIYESLVEQAKVQAKTETGQIMSDEDIVNALVEVARPAVKMVVGEEVSREGKPAAGQGNDGTVDWASYLLDEQPALLSAILLIMIFAMPFLVACGAFNLYSGDVQSKGLRYQLLRTERTNIYFGRFFGAAIYTVLVIVILMVIITSYIGLKIQIYEWGSLISWSLRGILALSLISIPYLAFCAWISGSIDSPIGSLVVCSLIIGAVPLFAMLGSMMWEHAVYVKYVMPWGIQDYLLHPKGSYVLGATAACLGYTVLFLFLGHRHFMKRDL